jgi:hypothetical protein
VSFMPSPDLNLSSLFFLQERAGSQKPKYSLLVCGAYYALWIWILPRLGKYRIRHQKIVLNGGEVTHKLVKVPLAQLQSWDAEHDAVGATIEDAPISSETIRVEV